MEALWLLDPKVEVSVFFDLNMYEVVTNKGFASHCKMQISLLCCLPLQERVGLQNGITKKGFHRQSAALVLFFHLHTHLLPFSTFYWLH